MSKLDDIFVSEEELEEEDQGGGEEDFEKTIRLVIRKAYEEGPRYYVTNITYLSDTGSGREVIGYVEIEKHSTLSLSGEMPESLEPIINLIEEKESVVFSTWFGEKLTDQEKSWLDSKTKSTGDTAD